MPSASGPRKDSKKFKIDRTSNMSFFLLFLGLHINCSSTISPLASNSKPTFSTNQKLSFLILSSWSIYIPILSVQLGGNNERPGCNFSRDMRKRRVEPLVELEVLTFGLALPCLLTGFNFFKAMTTLIAKMLLWGRKCVIKLHRRHVKSSVTSIT